MAFTGPDYVRLKSDKHVMMLLAPTGGATGVDNVFEPSAAELTPGTGGTVNASPSISWNDFDYGIQESERTSDPSLADDSTFEDFGQQNYGGGVSFYYPKEYDDNSNNHSLVYDLTDEEWTPLDVTLRIDGAKDNVADPIADGDLVHAARTITDAEANSLTGADALRRTIQFLSQGEIAVYTVVGPHTLSTITSSTPWAEGTKSRVRVSIQDRDVTCMDTLSFRSSDPDVVRIQSGGFYEVTGTAADTATITIEDEGAGTSTTVEVTVT